MSSNLDMLGDFENVSTVEDPIRSPFSSTVSSCTSLEDMEQALLVRKLYDM